MLIGMALMCQASFFECLFFDLPPFLDDGLVAAEVNVGRPASWPRTSIYDTISTSYMVTETPSTVRARRLRERRSRGVAMVAPVEVGGGGIDVLVCPAPLYLCHVIRDYL
jgi:hypothetical protein